MSRRVFAANWKMHLGPVAAREFMARVLPLIEPVEGRTLWFYPPAVSLPVVAGELAGRPDAHAGAQNLHWESRGAFTGEISAPMVLEAGGAGALVGHSERRHVFGETDADTGRKVRATLASTLVPMLCIGETLEQREGGLTEAVCLRQLAAALDGLDARALDRVLVAYEPVWAIGTGRTATPSDAAAVHRVVRRELRRLGASAPTILYGGSVNAGNVGALLAEDELDGVLVGSACLDPVGWADLVRAGWGS